jgi:uncharacterized protein YodC (DUF2158 family)
MTVESTDNYEGNTIAHCVWFNSAGENKRDAFPIEALTTEQSHSPKQRNVTVS